MTENKEVTDILNDIIKKPHKSIRLSASSEKSKQNRKFVTGNKEQISKDTPRQWKKSDRRKKIEDAIGMSMDDSLAAVYKDMYNRAFVDKDFEAQKFILSKYTPSNTRRLIEIDDLPIPNDIESVKLGIAKSISLMTTGQITIDELDRLTKIYAEQRRVIEIEQLENAFRQFKQLGFKSLHIEELLKDLLNRALSDEERKYILREVKEHLIDKKSA